jgi:tetratricopeptide (TPR) repeat protein
MKGLSQTQTVHSEKLKFFKEALEIYKTVYIERKKSLGLKHQYTTKAMRNIKFLNSEVGDLFLKIKTFNIALYHHYKSLEMNYEFYNLQKENLGANNEYTAKTHRVILKVLCDIAFTYSTIGKANEYGSDAEFKNALKIYEQVHSIRKNILGEKQETLTTLSCIASTYDNLGIFEKKKDKFKNALDYFEKAVRKCEEVYNAQNEKLGPQNEKTLLIKKTLSEYRQKCEESRQISLNEI